MHLDSGGWVPARASCATIESMRRRFNPIHAGPTQTSEVDVHVAPPVHGHLSRVARAGRRRGSPPPTRTSRSIRASRSTSPRHPPAGVANAPGEHALLRRHAPRFHLPAGHEGPIDFYRDYVAHGYLVTRDGVRIDGPTPEELNRHRDDPSAQFVHVPGGEVPRPVVYAGVERTDLWTSLLPGLKDEEFTVAVYHLVFRVSGLPAALPGLVAVSLGLGGRSRRLAPARPLHGRVRGARRRGTPGRPHPAAAQLPSHVPGRGVGGARSRSAGSTSMSRSGRTSCTRTSSERRRRRAVRFPSPEAMAFMMGYGKRPLMSADDVTDPDRTVDYRACVPARRRRVLHLPRFSRRSPPPAGPGRTAGRALQHAAAAQAAAGAGPRGLLARGERGRLAALPPQPGAQRRPGRVFPRAGAGLPSQPGLRAAGDGGLHAGVKRCSAGALGACRAVGHHRGGCVLR